MLKIIFYAVLALSLWACATFQPGPAAATKAPATRSTPQVFAPVIQPGLPASTPSAQACPAPSHTIDIAPQYFGRGVGESPVWAITGGSELVWSMADIRVGAHTEHGYQHKVLWVIEKAYRGIVSLRGGNLENGELLWFQIEGEEPTTNPVLDPAKPSAYSNPDYADFPSNLLVPGAGCYFLEADWVEGTWRANLTVTE